MLNFKEKTLTIDVIIIVLFVTTFYTKYISSIIY